MSYGSDHAHYNYAEEHHNHDYADSRHTHDEGELYGVARDGHEHLLNQVAGAAAHDHDHDGYVSHAAVVEMFSRAEASIAKANDRIGKLADLASSLIADLEGQCSALRERVGELEATDRELREALSMPPGGPSLDGQADELEHQADVLVPLEHVAEVPGD